MDTPFKGVFYSLGKRHPYAKFSELVTVTPSSTYPGKGEAIYVIDPHFSYTNESNWISKSAINSSLTFSFINDRLLLKSYIIKTRTDKIYCCPIEWVVEGSNDGVSWTQLHHKVSGTEQCEMGKAVRYNCATKQSFKSFKITQLGKNQNPIVEADQHIFGLNKLEVYGKLDSCPMIPTCNNNFCNKLNILLTAAIQLAS